MYEIRHYLRSDGSDVFQDWLKQLRDGLAKVSIIKRVNRTGPGYRVYYAMSGQQVVLLLTGGNKGSQDADIDRACAYWKDWQTR